MSLALNTDYLIVGQGVAGSILADKLSRRGHSVWVVDDGHLSSSSIVAAGIMNPITGRRFVKSWMYDELYSTALDYYHNLNIEDLVRPIPIHRVLKSAGEENDWLSRSAQEGWGQYMGHSTSNQIAGIKSEGISIGLIQHAYTINISKLLQQAKHQLITSGNYLQEKFDFNRLNKKDNHWEYKDITARKIVFCEGANVIQNPYFNYLPLIPAKGELLIIKSDRLPKDRIIKGDLMIVPLYDDYFWIGASYQWDYLTDLPSRSKHDFLKERLDNMMDHDYELIMQSAAIRPTVKDRRPLLGEHATHVGMFVFNGLGTKGTSLAPYFADHFIDFAEHKKELLADVDIARFN